MKISPPLVIVSVALSLTTPIPAAAASERPYYDHSMQALGSSELGMPPIRRNADGLVSCAPTFFGEVLAPCVD